MDNRRFDAFTRTLTTSDSPRRAILQGLGASALAAVVGRFAGEAAEAKKGKNKKKKKCKGNTTKCGKKACCRANQTCFDGRCVADIIEVPECFIDDDCELNEVCDDGTCVVPSPECEVSGDCGLGDECVAGTCVFIQGTCNVTDDHCSVTEALCNPAAGKDCFCLQRFGGGVACAERFVPDAICGACNSDAACEALEAGSICVKAVTQGAQGCPCDPGLGICARLCPNQ